MRKWTLLLIPTLIAALLAAVSPAAAQGFADLPGLERAVVRAWLAPESADTSAASPVPGQDLVGTPAPTLDPATVSGTLFLSIGVFEFDSDDTAIGGFDSLASYVAQVSDGDPQFAGGSRTELGIGDQSLAATSTQAKDDIPFSFLVAVVRQGDLVFLLQGTLVRLDATTETSRLVTSLLAGVPGEESGTYDPAGGSTGGLWNVFANVEPAIVPGTEVLDATVK